MVETKPTEDYFSFFAEEFLFWREKKISKALLIQSLYDLESTNPLVFLIIIKGNVVELLDKKNKPPDVFLTRAHQYCSFLRKVVSRYPMKNNVVMAFYTSDGEVIGCDFPTFAFQKCITSNNFLLPDIDFIITNYYQDDKFNDIQEDFVRKIDSAIFVGSTTGALNVTFNKDMLLKKEVPRVNSAVYFKDKQNVIFMLPSIVQHKDDETYHYLRSLGFGSGQTVTYQEQFNHKFMISMDGNGAACSRVALTLKSKSVLLKYDSSSILFYFKKLVPWFHYIPIKSDEDVLAVVGLEKKHPGIFSSIVKNAQKFYEETLKEDTLIGYTASLLHNYSENLFTNEDYVRQNFEPLTYAAIDNKLATQVGHIVGQSIQSTGRAGFLMYGPYVSMPAGSYQVLLEGIVTDRADEVTVDAVMYGASISLARIQLDRNQPHAYLAKFEISSDIPYSGLEIRVLVGAHAEVQVSRLEIIRIAK